MIEYERRIKSTGQGMARYGSCERCGKVCNMTYKQQYHKKDSEHNGWIDVGFGHIECLQNDSFTNAPIDHNS